MNKTLYLPLILSLILSTICLAEDKQKPKTLPLFNGKDLKDWTLTEFGGEGEIYLENKAIVMEEGVTLTGITWKKEFPKSNYELLIEARRTSGTDFFSAVTFPVKESYCSFINGGWGGAVVGLSSVDGEDASENQTRQYIAFKDDQWYQFRIRVTDEKIKVWIDKKPIIDLPLKDRKISTRVEVDLSKPLGISAWQSTAEIRKIELTKLEK